MKTNKLLLYIMLFLAVFSATVLADSLNLDNVVVSPREVIFSGESSVQVSVTFDVKNTNDVPINTVELTAPITGPSSISNPAKQTFSLGIMEKVTKTFTYNFPSTAKTGNYPITITANDPSDVGQSSTNAVIIVRESPLLKVTKDGSTVSELLIKGEDGTSDITFNLKLENKGNVDLTNLRLSLDPEILKDDDDDQVKIALSKTLISGLTAGSSTDLIVRAEIENGFDIGSKSGKLIIRADQNAFETFLPIKVEVSPLSCPANANSKAFKIDIHEPDDSDTFEPGDVLHARIDVTNDLSDDTRTKVEVMLYDEDNNKKIDSQTDEMKIKDGEEESYFFEFSLDDTDLDEGVQIGIYVKAYEKGDENTNCADDSITVDFELPEHSLTFNSLSLTPQVSTCGSRASVNAVVQNLGSNLERTVLRVSNPELNLDLSSQDLRIGDDRSREDNLANINLAFNIPQDASNDVYPIDVSARYSGQTLQEQLSLTLTNCAGDTSTITKTTQVTTGTSTGTVVTGTPFTGSAVTDKSFFDSFSSGNFKVPTSVWVLVDIVLVLGVISLLVFLFKKH